MRMKFSKLGKPPKMGDGDEGSLQYWQKVKNLFGSALIGYWPLWEQSGTTAQDYSGNGRNAAYGGATVGNATALSGRPCPTFDGNNDFVNIYGASFAAAFNGKEGTAIAVLKHTAAFWSGAARYDFSIYPNNDNNMAIQRAADGTYKAAYKAATVTKVAPLPAGSENWMIVAMTWSDSGDFVKAYLNGRLYSNTGSVGTWQDPALLATTTVFGGLSTSGGDNCIIGNMSDLILLNRVASDAEILQHFNIICPDAKVFSILGDSISVNSITNWHTDTTMAYNAGRCSTINHAVAGQEILTRLAGQVTAAAGDNADIIIIQMGANDDNAGNMTTLQGVIETQLAALKASNPRAAIYWLNVLPMWTDSTGATPVDKTNIRAAVAAGCAAAGVTCWDTFSTPWITAGQTSDGTHPTLAGHSAIATQALALL